MLEKHKSLETIQFHSNNSFNILFLYKYILLLVELLATTSQWHNFRNRLLPASAKIHIYMKTEMYSNNHIWTIKNPLLRTVFIFPLRATPLPPLCWLRVPAGAAVILSTPRSEAHPWRSSEPRVAPASWPTCMAPLAWLAWLPIEGSSWTSRLTCCTGNDGNNCFNSKTLSTRRLRRLSS